MQLAPANLPIDPSRSVAPAAVLAAAGLPMPGVSLPPDAAGPTDLFSALLGESCAATPAEDGTSDPVTVAAPVASPVSSAPRKSAEIAPSSDQLAAAAWAGWMPSPLPIAPTPAPGLPAEGEAPADDSDEPEVGSDSAFPRRMPAGSGEAPARSVAPGLPMASQLFSAKFAVALPVAEDPGVGPVSAPIAAPDAPAPATVPSAPEWGISSPAKGAAQASRAGAFPVALPAQAVSRAEAPASLSPAPLNLPTTNPVTLPLDPVATPVAAPQVSPAPASVPEAAVTLPVPVASPAESPIGAEIADAQPRPALSTDRATPVRTNRRIDRENPAGLTPEKIAAFTRPDSPRAVAAIEPAEKKILSVDEAEVTKHTEPLGIGAAKSAPAVSNSSSNHPATVTATVSPLAGRASEVVSSGSSESQAASHAQRAVATVLATAERLSSSGQSSVHLKFAVGDADLSVKIELRAGEVHTVFRTDSSELRSALTAAWQSVDTDTARGVRLADPVIAPATTSSGSDAQLSQDASGQSGSRRETAAAQSPIHWRHDSVESAAAPTVTDSRPALRPDLNLYAFA